MKQPKFRGFNRETNTWLYGHGWFKSNDQAVLYAEGYPVECELYSMGQYTGLKDKREREIWAGDIVEVRGKLMKVYFPEFNEYCVANSVYPASRKVVGNVVENNNLINGGF